MLFIPPERIHAVSTWITNVETAFRTRFENTPRHMTWQKATKTMMMKIGFYSGMGKYLYQMMITCG